MSTDSLFNFANELNSMCCQLKYDLKKFNGNYPVLIKINNLQKMLKDNTISDMKIKIATENNIVKQELYKHAKYLFTEITNLCNICEKITGIDRIKHLKHFEFIMEYQI